MPGRFAQAGVGCGAFWRAVLGACGGWLRYGVGTTHSFFQPYRKIPLKPIRRTDFFETAANRNSTATPPPKQRLKYFSESSACIPIPNGPNARLSWQGFFAFHLCYLCIYSPQPVLPAQYRFLPPMND